MLLKLSVDVQSNKILMHRNGKWFYIFIEEEEEDVEGRYDRELKSLRRSFDSIIHTF